MPLVTHSTLVGQLGKTWSRCFTAGIFSKENGIPCHMTHNSPFHGFFSFFEVPEKMPQEKKKEDARVFKKMALEPDISH